MCTLKLNTAYTRVFYLAGTGLGPTASISKAGGNFAAPAGGGGCVEIGNGFYSLALLAADTDTVGDLAYSFSNGTNTAAQIDQVDSAGVDPWATALPGSYANGTAGKILGSLVDPWSVALPGAYIPGEAGYILGHSAAGGDPWATALPGSYANGTAGALVGKNLNAAVSAVIYLLTRGNPPVV